MPESSRIIVKNLPKYINSDQVKDHFSEKGTITDVKLIHTPTGVFRRFAYIGFRTEKEARGAVHYFHNTFIDTSKIHVELARPVGDPELPRAWSKHTQRPEPVTVVDESVTECAKQKAAKQSYIDSLYEEERKRASLSSAMHVMQSRATKSTWQNDDSAGLSTVPPLQTAKKDKNVELVSVPNRKPGGEGMLVQRTKITFDSDDDNASDDDEYQTISSAPIFNHDNTTKATEDDRIAPNGLEPNTENESILDSQETPKPSSIPHTNKQTPPLDHPAVAATSIKSKVVPRTAEDIATDTKVIQETCRIFLVNLPYSASEEEIITLCQAYGAISSTHMPLHFETKQSKGVAFVKYVTAADALLAYKMLQGQIYMGRRIHVRGAEPAPTTSTKVEISDPKLSSFKARQLSIRASTATQNKFNWNALFMGSDAVASAMADKLQVSKSDILDRESDNMAVRLALSETHVIAETKQYLAQHGVVLDAFDLQHNRSDSVLLIKNIPFQTSIDDIVALVQPFGEIGRVLVPPAGTIGLVEFLVPADAQKAFRALAYKRFKSLPLYLEYAPKACFHVPYDSDKHCAGQFGKVSASASSNGIESSPNDKTKTNRKRLQSAAFLGEDGIDEVKMISGIDAVQTKLIVRNVPFEATVQDLKQLFGPFAHVKSVRLPKKVTGGHRGFAFAEFLTHADAVEAIRALKHTHLYGRRLVIEFAKKGMSVEEMQEKTRSSLVAQETAGHKKHKLIDMSSFEQVHAGGESDEEDR